MSNYPVSPPTYKPAGSTQKPNYNSFDESREPLLAGSSSGRGIYDQPNPGDLPDDFKVRDFPLAVHCRWFLTRLSLSVWGLSC